MLTILIADDHVLVREGIISVLQDLEPEVKILEAGNLNEIQNLVSQNNELDLVLLDLKMPGMEGYAGLKIIKEIAPSLLVVILSSYDEPAIIEECIKKGADGFIPKSYSKDVLINAVRLVLAGEVFIPSRILKGQPVLFGGTPKGMGSLTPRQKEILELMGEGLSNKEIARLFDCAESTVKAHVSAVLKAFGVASRAKAVAASQDSTI